MSERLWVYFGLLLGLAFAVQVAMPVDLTESPETSFETAPRGHAALFELLNRFDAVEGRWTSGLSMPDAEDTVWWIASPGICDEESELSRVDRNQEASPETESGAESIGEDVVPFRWTVEPWIESGGTAIVWLSHPPVAVEEERNPIITPESEPETREVSYRGPGSARAPRRSAALDDPWNSGDSGPSDSDAGNDPEGAEGNDAKGAEGNDAGGAEGNGAEDDEGNDAEGDAGKKTPSEAEDEFEDAESVREGWRSAIDETRVNYREGASRRCRGIAGYRLPERRLAGLEGGELPVDADYAATAFSVGRWVESRSDFDYEAARILPGPTLAFFESDADLLDGWQPLFVEANDFTPFAIERRIGEGRLVVVADARVLTNARLGRIDSAPFVFDWVRGWGRPWVDEHRHGIVPESGTFRYLATSPAWAACLGLLALGGLVIWRGHAIPRREVDEVLPDAPTLAAFVDSLALLYGRTGDHARAFERYRSLSLDRIRRILGLAPDTSEETVLATLRARADNRPATRERGLRDALAKDLRIENAGALDRATARLDGLVEVLNQEKGPANAARPKKS